VDQNPTVLIVDDEPDHRLLLASALREAMPEVYVKEAGGTEEALDAISEEDFDLLRVCDEPNEVIDTIGKWYAKQEVVGRKAVVKERLS